jgi:hypothetical protein
MGPVLGFPAEIVVGRQAKLTGFPSPFIDSGYHFEDYPDITLCSDDYTKTRRLNMVVAQLLSRGLCKIGDSSNGSHDQAYTPLENS